MLLRHPCLSLQNWLNICLLNNKEPNFDERQKDELKVFNLSKSKKNWLKIYLKIVFSYSSKDGSIFECEDDTFSSANIKILYLHKCYLPICTCFSKKWALPHGLLTVGGLEKWGERYKDWGRFKKREMYYEVCKWKVGVLNYNIYSFWSFIFSHIVKKVK